MRKLIILAATIALAACQTPPGGQPILTPPAQLNPLGDTGQITINQTTGQASAAPGPGAPAGADLITTLAFDLGKTYGPDDANAINISTGGVFNSATGLWVYPPSALDPDALACWNALAALSNALSAANAGPQGTGGGVLTDIAYARLLLLQLQGAGANPLLSAVLKTCVTMAQETVAMGKALPLEFQNLMNSVLMTAMTTGGGLPVPLMARQPHPVARHPAMAPRPAPMPPATVPPPAAAPGKTELKKRDKAALLRSMKEWAAQHDMQEWAEANGR